MPLLGYTLLLVLCQAILLILMKVLPHSVTFVVENTHCNPRRDTHELLHRSRVVRIFISSSRQVMGVVCVNLSPRFISDQGYLPLLTNGSGAEMIVNMFSIFLR